MKVAIIDSNYLLREGLKKVLLREENIEIIGECSSVKEAQNIILNEKPDLVIIDFKLGKENGLTVVEEAKAKGIGCKFMILTTSSEYKDLKAAEKTGVEGYVLKDAMPEEIIHAVKVLNAGRKYYDTNLIINAINMEKEDTNKSEAVQTLTKREREVLIALGSGLSNNEIASLLEITEFTVKKHVSQVLLKLNFVDRTQAAIFANLHGLIS